MVTRMASGAMFCGQCVFVVMIICCPAAVQTDALDTYYNMTNGFLDVVQPEPYLSGKNDSNVALRRPTCRRTKGGSPGTPSSTFHYFAKNPCTTRNSANLWTSAVAMHLLVVARLVCKCVIFCLRPTVTQICLYITYFL